MTTWQTIRDESRRRRDAGWGRYDLRVYWRGRAFLEHDGEPEPLVRAHAFVSMLEHLPLYIYEGDMIAGSRLGFCTDVLPGEITEHDYEAGCAAHAARPHRNFTTGWSHTLGDYRPLLKEGIQGTLDRVGESLRSERTNGERITLEAMRVTLLGFAEFAHRYANACRAVGQTDVAARLDHIAVAPPRDLHEAIQLIWLVHIAFVAEGRGHNALGRLDQYLWQFYEQDRADGVLTRDQALEMFYILWAHVSELGEVTNICIGGLTPGGQDATNELSYICLEATQLVQSPHTNLSARFHDNSPARFHRACFECIRTGVGFPAIFNDHVLIPGLVEIGIPEEIARDHCMVGCIETMLAGRQPAWSDGRYNTPRNLCRALQRLREEPVPSYERLMALFTEESERYMDEYCGRISSAIRDMPASRCPDPFLSVLTRDCIARARDINDDGAEFPRMHGVAVMGLGTLADSLAAMKKLVFEEKRLAFDELMAALDADFAGYEPVRQILLNEAPKYGNADPYVDNIAAWLVDYFARLCLMHRLPDGGWFVSGMAANVSNIPAGREISATPDGRYAGTPLSDAASPSFGRDINGPTAFLASVATPDYHRVLTGTVVNMKFEPELFQGEAGAARFAAFTDYFVRNRIHQLQFNVTGNRVLKDAQKNPETYRNLVVRVSGFSAYFVQLAPDVQNDVIRRRAHTG